VTGDTLLIGASTDFRIVDPQTGIERSRVAFNKVSLVRPVAFKDGFLVRTYDSSSVALRALSMPTLSETWAQQVDIADVAHSDLSSEGAAVVHGSDLAMMVRQWSLVFFTTGVQGSK
jgi:hypothetical protein